MDNEGEDQKDFYIVFLRDDDRPIISKDGTFLKKHVDVLSIIKGSDEDAKKSLVYSYHRSFHAFAAKLSAKEAQELSGMEEVILVIPNRYRKLHTTRSWDFLGLSQTAKRKLNSESNTIVALLDTGITPESESFNDDGLGPPPSKWKGSCAHFANFTGCNNKLIGAKYFKLDGNIDAEDILSPVDVDGHGTHTSSTLSGSVVPDANLFGLAKGTARGAVPSARVAMYKVCWEGSGCADMDILAAFEEAIHDGVDLISISIGGATESYEKDSISLGAFHALRNGILTVASAGNDGPQLGSVANHAPWLFTVGATGIDRGFFSKVVFGDGHSLFGIGINVFEPKQKSYPLVSGADVAKSEEEKGSARFCYESSIDHKKVKGKLVLCELAQWGADSVIKGLGGIGIILQSDVFNDCPQIYMAPATMVNSTVGHAIDKYIHSTTSAAAVIYKSQEEKIPAPFVASFSSRGPNPGSLHILKPDIAAPGIDILAAYTPLKSLTGLKGDTLYSKFSIMSGTSMACPHVGGVAAYVKSFHPNWSPSAIKSAIMTTATPMSKRKNHKAEFAYGVGQVNPRKALSPGLVYDMDAMSYIQFLCHEGYNSSQLAPLLGSQSVNCSSMIPGLGYDAINYPTMQLSMNGNMKQSITAVFTRTVTNVGPPQSTYNATIRAPKGVEITVTPTSLDFSPSTQKRSFKVVVKADPFEGVILSGSLTWKSLHHIVRSPIVLYKQA